jgi:hypothetical protein
LKKHSHILRKAWPAAHHRRQPAHEGVSDRSLGKRLGKQLDRPDQFGG